MKNEIVILIPNETLVEQVRALLAERNIHYPVYVSPIHSEEMIIQANNLIRQGARVIICRGLAVNVLRDNLKIPVVEIRYTYDEFVRAVTEALAYSKRIALAGYNSHFRLPELADLFDFEQLEFRIIESPRQTRKTMQELKKLGVEAVVSGRRIGEVAQEFGMKNFQVWISTENLMDAIRDARHLRRLEREKQRQFESIASLLDHTEEGILSIDNGGKILSANQEAEKILRMPGGSEGRSVFDYFPKPLIEKILGGMPVFDEVISLFGDAVLVSGTANQSGADAAPGAGSGSGAGAAAGTGASPENPGGAPEREEYNGAVLTLEPASDVHRKEYELRRRAHDKGHVAKHTFNDIIGSSAAQKKKKNQAAVFAATDSSVLITGETGTGKELFAQSIHNSSQRRGKPFVAINCAALPESVLESELFGYVKGAFTGARTEGKTGIFEQAHTGTIFLDEIGEISQATQARLLRVIQEREITRIGDDRIIPIDVRIITSTNRNLYKEIEEGRFREDLFYRINVLSLRLPSLSERKEDIPALMRYFVGHYARVMRRDIRLSEEAEARVKELPWPGNIRQLRNFAESAVAVCQKDEIDSEIIDKILHMAGRDQAEYAGSAVLTEQTQMPAPEHRYIHSRRPEAEEQAEILRVLKECGGNKTRAAKILGIGYATLWRRLKKLDEKAASEE